MPGMACLCVESISIMICSTNRLNRHISMSGFDLSHVVALFLQTDIFHCQKLISFKSSEVNAACQTDISGRSEGQFAVAAKLGGLCAEIPTTCHKLARPRVQINLLNPPDVPQNMGRMYRNVPLKMARLLLMVMYPQH